jgi:hypothetical protein
MTRIKLQRWFERGEWRKADAARDISTTTPRENSTDQELFWHQLDEAQLAERIGIDQKWFLERHLQPSATPSPNLMIAAASQQNAAYQICEYGHSAGDDRAVHGCGPLATSPQRCSP